MAAEQLTPEELKRKKHRDYMRKYIAEHPEQREAARARSRQYSRAHRQEQQEKKNVWRRENPELDRAARARHRVRVRERERKWAERPEGRISVMVTDARARARRTGVEFDATLRAHLSAHPPTHCPCCKLPLNYSLWRDKQLFPLDRSPSLDRFDPAKGYTVENVNLICYRCNTLKSNASAAELEMVAAWMRSRHQAGE